MTLPVSNSSLDVDKAEGATRESAPAARTVAVAMGPLFELSCWRVTREHWSGPLYCTADVFRIIKYVMLYDDYDLETILRHLLIAARSTLAAAGEADEFSWAIGRHAVTLGLIRVEAATKRFDVLRLVRGPANFGGGSAARFRPEELKSHGGSC